jgi:hypothetical protein
MMANDPDAARWTLTREVEPPQSNHSGLGIMLVASAAMFFAVSGSAMILRARMAQCHELRTRVVAPPLVAPPVAPSCGGLTYAVEPDGTMSARYVVCPTVTVEYVGDAVYATELPAEIELRVPEPQ